ncbi:MAG: DUF4249 domain-containing protein [Bacteroidota bacterium]|nr:DUF4249 domain-containing protein [Bacteroidota bacterium]
MKKIALYILLMAFISACTEKVNITLKQNYTRLVVDGSIGNSSSRYQITLTKTADYFYNQPIPRVNNAQVSISDGNAFFQLNETKPGISGIYETDSSFHGVTGKIYTLHITLPEAIGGSSEYIASCKMMDVPKLDSIHVLFHPDYGKDGMWEIKVYAQEPGDEVNYYMFHVYRNDTLLTDSISKVVVTDDKYFNGNYINGLGAVYINNSHYWETLHEGDLITLQMSGITKEYYDFITQVQEAGFNIPFFVGPPANVVGNISSGGIGFFAAYSSSFSSIRIKQ